jgi:hypothetical protein
MELRLCYSDTSEQHPIQRLNRFFSSLYAVLKKEARAVLQFYPETPEQVRTDTCGWLACLTSHIVCLRLTSCFTHYLHLV